MADAEVGDGQQPKKKKYLIRFKSRREQWILVYPFLRESKRGKLMLFAAFTIQISVLEMVEKMISRDMSL